ncbi:hypothetical protein QR680_006615 [Steinernema hermaphroditum]|uniref:PH domain-containing protein n=1 Tax=Steinernema hermaphroditum TaxID=289476 RepID=A0AA39HXG7_9BILA|nr:hypothetical protein QR680_006615 [Steinernema hermaphroditum]
MTNRTPSPRQDGTTSHLLRKITFWRRNFTHGTVGDTDERVRSVSDAHHNTIPLEDGSDEIRRFIAGQGAVIKSGSLARKRFKLGIFSKFFVLKDDGHFYCFKNESCDRQNGMLKLKEAFIVPHGKRCFSVTSPHRVWNLKARTNEDRDDWIEKLKLARACAQAKEENELEFLSNRTNPANASTLQELNLTALKAILLDLLKAVKSLSSDLQNNDLRKHYKQQSKSWFNGWGTKQEEDLQDCLIALSIKMSHVKSATKKAVEEVDRADTASKRLLAENLYVQDQRRRLIEQVEMQAKQLGLIEKATNTKGVQMNQQTKDELKKVEESYTHAPVFSAIEYSCINPSEKLEKLTETKSEEELAAAKPEPVKPASVKPASVKPAPVKPPAPVNPTPVNVVHANPVRVKSAAVGSAASSSVNYTPKENASDEKQTTTPVVTSVTLEPKERNRESSESDSDRKPEKNHATRAPSPSPARVPAVRKRRTTIPPRREAGFALWSILKNALGKELSRIPLPVDFNEPLSFIQRMTESLENADLLERAAECTDPTIQMCMVAAFVVSCWSNTPFRTTKPFNPLWGETYECDRMEDLGWRSIAEQVSHHPPIGVFRAEGRGWNLEEDMQVCSQFQATAMRVYPEGLSTLVLKGNKRYSWTKRDVKTIVKGFIIGPLTLHNEGECTIMSHSNQFKCVLNLTKQSFFFSPDCRTFTGRVLDRSGKEMAKVEGNWTTHFDIAIGKGKRNRIWSKALPTPDQEKIYNFSRFAVELNEPEDGVAPTDSRFRPDMRLMEVGDWGRANDEKSRMEQKQREMMKLYTSQVEAGKKVLERPVWFKKIVSPENGSVHYRFKGHYWDAKKKQDWSMCPEIYFSDKK